VRESEDLTARLRPKQGNAFAYRRLLESPEREGWSRSRAALDYTRAIAAAEESLQERSVDIAVGRRLVEANGSVPEALGNLVTDYERAFSTLKSQIADIRSDADSLLKQYCDDQTMLTRALGKLNLREAEFERLRSSFEQANLKQHAVEVELASGLAQNDALRSELATTRVDSDTLRADLANASAQNDALRVELATGRVESDALRAELVTGRAESDALRAELVTGRAESDALRAELENARAQNDALRAELATGQAESDALRAEQAHAHAENDWLRAEMAKHKVQLRALKKSVSWQITSPLRVVKKGILWFLPGDSKPDRP
jgi:chromosome segregation ATPase